MPKFNPLQNTLEPKTYLYICLGVLVLIGLLHTFMLQVVFPEQQGTISLYVPAKSGGKDFFIDTDEFTTTSTIALVVTILITAAVSALLRVKKLSLATTLTFLLVASSTIYLALYAGNAFDELWGTAASVLVVVGVLIVGTALELPLLKAMSDGTRKRS